MTALQALWASKHLSESIQQEHSVVWGFLKDMCHSLMTPLQVPSLLWGSLKLQSCKLCQAAACLVDLSSMLGPASLLQCSSIPSVSERCRLSASTHPFDASLKSDPALASQAGSIMPYWTMRSRVWNLNKARYKA